MKPLIQVWSLVLYLSRLGWKGKADSGEIEELLGVRREECLGFKGVA